MSVTLNANNTHSLLKSIVELTTIYYKKGSEHYNSKSKYPSHAPQNLTFVLC